MKVAVDIVEGLYSSRISLLLIIPEANLTGFTLSDNLGNYYRLGRQKQTLAAHSTVVSDHS